MTRHRSTRTGTATAVALGLSLVLTMALTGCGPFSPLDAQDDPTQSPSPQTGDSQSSPVAPRSQDRPQPPPSGPPSSAPPTDEPDTGDDVPDIDESDDPGSTVRTSGSTGSSAQGSSTPGVSGTSAGQPRYYGWHLPLSDPSPNELLDGPVYEEIRVNGCTKGDEYLTGGTTRYTLTSPRAAVFLAAAIAFCRAFEIDRSGTLVLGASGQAEQLALGRLAYAEGVAYKPSLEGLAVRRSTCDLYRSLKEFVEQSPSDSFVCPGGAGPGYRFAAHPTTAAGIDGPVVLVLDDPLTFGVDERTDRTTYPTCGLPGVEPYLIEENFPFSGVTTECTEASALAAESTSVAVGTDSDATSPSPATEAQLEVPEAESSSSDASVPPEPAASTGPEPNGPEPEASIEPEPAREPAPADLAPLSPAENTAETAPTEDVTP